MKNLLSIESLSAEEILAILDDTAVMKSTRGRHAAHPLRHQCWALIFSKSSTRTRVSFEVGIRELGGDAMFLAAADIQLGRGEPIKDTARVMGRMLHGAVIRTFAQQDVEEFAEFSGIPTINALTDEEHPCQILTDLFTIRETRGSLDGLRVAFIGDADCNVARSWIWAAARLGFELVLAASPGALVMHCLPAYRGKEIDDTTFEAHADTIFRQAENRLHTQKAIMARLVGARLQA
jgi:ornithine carbamoyltransferase